MVAAEAGARTVHSNVRCCSDPTRRPVDLYVDVSTRQLDALSRQYAVPLDLRGQRRGSAWTCAVRLLLPAVRRRGGVRTRVHEPALEDSDNRCERCDRRSARRLFRPVSAFARACADTAVHHLGNYRGACGSLPGHVVPDAVLFRRSRGAEDWRTRGRRRRVLGAHRGFSGRHGPGADAAQTVAKPLDVMFRLLKPRSPEEREDTKKIPPGNLRRCGEIEKTT